jgi:RimJ/RimL family protein N-acetyltransferase
MMFGKPRHWRYSITICKVLLMADPRSYYAQETLKDGTPVTIRAIRKDDKERLLQAFRALDREAVYRRFFSPKKNLTSTELEQVTDVDFRQVVALVATSQVNGEEILVGDGRYAAAKGENPECAEIAFIVAEPYRGRGIASLLLRHLTRIAQEAGLSAFEAEVLAYNAPMLAVFLRSGLPICRRHEGYLVHVTLSLASAPDPAKS